MNNNIITRPEGTNVERYIHMKKNIKSFVSNNRDYIREYNREYQRKLRDDPEQYYILQMRIRLRQYLTGSVKNSPTMERLLGTTRVELAKKYKLTDAEFKEMVKNNTVDTIVGYSWIKKHQYHLFPYMFRWYNIQFISKKQNQKNHAYIDENNSSISDIVKKMNTEHTESV